jgi:hypothetical protein
MTRSLVKAKTFASEPFTLLDVGCSGGISPFWRVFEPSFAAIAVDPVVAECERLSAQETNPLVRYRSRFTGLPEDDPFVLRRGAREPWTGNPWNRLSTKLASEILQSRITKEAERLSTLNDWQGCTLAPSETKVTIDSLVQEEKLTDLDFIKVDVDGYDLDVILSSEKSTNQFPVIGYMLEINFFGSDSESDNTFHNTDRLMRRWGFDLFGLSVRHYSSSALPAPFKFNWPGYTIFGRPYQGDAVYLRDPIAKAHERSLQLSGSKLLKLASLFECFGLPDHAAELIVANRHALSNLCKPEELLCILANEIDPTVRNYSEYLERFSSDPTTFYPSSKMAVPHGIMPRERWSSVMRSVFSQRLPNVFARMGRFLHNVI